MSISKTIKLMEQMKKKSSCKETKKQLDLRIELLKSYK